MILLLIIFAVLIFVIGYYCGKNATPQIKPKSNDTHEQRFSKLNDKEPAFLRKIKEKNET